jgi:hypothetical protein
MSSSGDDGFSKDTNTPASSLQVKPAGQGGLEAFHDGQRPVQVFAI